MSLRRQATHAAIWGMAQKWGYHAMRLIVFVVLARLLSPASFGLVALASVFILLGQILVDQGFSDALVQRRTIGPAHLDAAFWASAVSGLLLTAACFFSAGWLAQAFGEPRLGPVLHWLSPVLLIGSLSGTQEALLRRDLAFKRIATISLMAMGAGGAVGLAMAILNWGVWSLVGQIMVQRLVQLPLLWYATGWRPRLRFSPRHFRALFSFGAHVLVTGLFNFSNRQSDHLLIGYVLGSTALGYYTIGYRLIRILLDLLPHALLPVAFSAFSRLQTDLKRMRKALYESSQLMALATLPVFCGVAVLAPELIGTLFGARWEPSAGVMLVLTPIAAQQSLSILYMTALKARGKPGVVLALTALNAAANVVAFMLAVRWGIVAVAASYTIRGYLLWPVSWAVLRRYLGVDLGRYLSALAPALAATAVMAAVIVPARAWLLSIGEPHVALFACTILGMVVYAAAARIAAPARYHEIRRFFGKPKQVRQARP